MPPFSINPTAATLLGFLLEGPHTGWDLVQVIERSVGNFWNVTRSQVYRELKTLAAEGYVTEKKKPGPRDRVPYVITAAGKAAFAEWIAKTPGAETVRLPIVLTVFFGRRVPPELLRRYLEKARLEHVTRVDEYRALRASGVVKDEYQRAALNVGIGLEETMIDWIESLPWIKASRGRS
jgi:DNA-binding PadR family transcriptional regulator